jgi:DNA-directed RNA polymerase subunit alpha
MINYNLSYPSIKSKLVSHTDTKHTLTIEPLLPGYGFTIGNSLRRIFLSSIPGYAVTKVRINDITHEYQAIPSVVEDAMDIVLNLKNLRSKILTDDESVVLTLNKKTSGDVFASDFDSNSKVKIANEDLYIAHLDKGGELNIEVEISKGHGYLSVDEVNLSSTTNPLDIVVDSLFSPVTNVMFNVEKVRVGDKTNFDKIILDFETDATVEAVDAVNYAFKLMYEITGNIMSSFGSSVDIAKHAPTKTTSDTDVVISDNDDEIDLPTRVKNTLAKHGITTNAELLNRADELTTISDIGPATLVKIQEYITTNLQ